MTTAPVKGTLAAVTVDSTDISTWTTDAQLKRGSDKEEVTAFGDSGHKYTGTLTNHSFSASGWYDSTGTTGTAAVLDGNEGTTQSIVYGPEGDASGKPSQTFSGLLDDYTLTSAVGGIVKWAASWTVSGDITTSSY